MKMKKEIKGECDEVVGLKGLEVLGLRCLEVLGFRSFGVGELVSWWVEG